MKFYLTFIIAIALNAMVNAQTDTVSLFHQSPNSIAKGNLYANKNAINFNLLQLTRGGILVNYERFLGNSGMSITVGIGISIFDPLGQFYVKKFDYYYKPDNYYSNEKETSIRALYDIGTKYYFDKQMGGSYLGAGFTSIANSVTIRLNDYNSIYTINNSTKYQLDYRSNEIKFLIGFQNENQSQFYNDFNFGLGYRMITYESLVINNTNNTQNYNPEVNKVNKTNQTPWFFMSWKMGIRF